MRLSSENFSITKTIKRAPSLDRRVFSDIKNDVLGKEYKLSLVFIGEKRSRTLNRSWRGIDKATDILSFPLSKSEGEILINPNRTVVEAKKFGRKFDNFLAFLFIHGLCHLKGMTHGSRMEREERRYRKTFQI